MLALCFPEIGRLAPHLRHQTRVTRCEWQAQALARFNLNDEGKGWQRFQRRRSRLFPQGLAGVVSWFGCPSCRALRVLQQPLLLFKLLSFADRASLAELGSPCQLLELLARAADDFQVPGQYFLIPPRA